MKNDTGPVTAYWHNVVHLSDPGGLTVLPVTCYTDSFLSL
jgi:hypothetical protein